MLRKAEQMDLFNLLEPEEAREQLEEWLGEKCDEFCRCGARLVEWETGAGVCHACRIAMEREKTELEAKVEPKLKRMGIPPRYWDCSLETYSGEPPSDVLDWIIRPFGRSLLLWGPDTGVGKTHLGTAALRSLDSGGHRCFWAASVELSRRMALEAFDKDQPTKHKSARVEFLMVDDFGAEAGLPQGTAWMETLLEERYKYHRPTIITTNLTPEQLFENYPRLASRLNDGIVVELAGRDMRVFRDPTKPPWEE